MLFYSLVVNQHRRRDASLESQQNLMWEEANAKCLIHLVIFTVLQYSYPSLTPILTLNPLILAITLKWHKLTSPPFPQIDIIRAVVIVWRVRRKTIRSVLCNIVCNNCAQCDAHTYEQTNSSLDWVLSHWAHFTVLRDSFLHVLCVLLYTVCMCRFVTRWGGPGGIEAYP